MADTGNTSEPQASNTTGLDSHIPQSHPTPADISSPLNNTSSQSPPLPTASSPVADSHDTSQPPPRQQPVQPEQNVSPELAALRSMFPDYDDTILQSVLESVGWNQDRAIDMLLGMSDPNYKAEAHPVEPQLSQTELDEQLARRLMLEDQEDHQRRWQQQQQRPPAATGRNVPYQVYQPHQQPPQQGGPTGERDTMTEFQDQFNKFAETGKKTIGSLFSKVKAKIQEFDQPRPGQGTQPTWGSSGNASQNTQSQQGYYAQQQPPTQPQPQAAYYDPNPPMAAHAPSPPPRTSAGNPQGYDVSTSPPIAESSVPQPQAQSSAARQLTPIDGGKLGLLPKRPVSLVRDPPSSQAQGKPNDDDDDGLEYAENPFEDSRK